MNHKIQRVSEVSSNTFKELIMLWLVIVLFTVVAAILMSAASAKAEIYIPLAKVEKIVQPADFKNFTSLPTPALIQGRCETLLHPQHNSISNSNVIGRTQRNAENQGLQTVMAIKAYRHCVSQVVLGQLASK